MTFRALWMLKLIALTQDHHSSTEPLKVNYTTGLWLTAIKPLTRHIFLLIGTPPPPLLKHVDQNLSPIIFLRNIPHFQSLSLTNVTIIKPLTLWNPLVFSFLWTEIQHLLMTCSFAKWILFYAFFPFGKFEVYLCCVQCRTTNACIFALRIL